MGWLQRLFKMEKPQNAKVNPTPQSQPTQSTSGGSQAPTGNQAPLGGQTQSIPPERMGLNGEYDQSGLAKRVALAFDEDPDLDDINTLYVAQTGGTVVLKGEVPNQQALSKMVNVAQRVNGATSVDTKQVKVA